MAHGFLYRGKCGVQRRVSVVRAERIVLIVGGIIGGVGVNPVGPRDYLVVVGMACGRPARIGLAMPRVKRIEGLSVVGRVVVVYLVNAGEADVLQGLLQFLAGFLYALGLAATQITLQVGCDIRIDYRLNRASRTALHLLVSFSFSLLELPS